MEIRRKVFSLLEDSKGEERLYSTNEFELESQENEKLFSTGDEELDNLLTEVYYSGIEDGYDYFQKEFAEKKENKKKVDKTGAALTGSVVAAGLGTSGVGIAQMAEAKKLKKIQDDQVPSARRIAEKRGLELRMNPIFMNHEFRDIAGEKEIQKIDEEIEQLRKKPATEETTKKMQELFEKERNIFDAASKKTREAAEEHSEYIGKLQKAGDKSAAKLKKLDKAGKIGLGVTAGLALANAGYKLSKQPKSNKKEEEKD